MAGFLTREAERRILQSLLINSSDKNQLFTQPIMMRLMSANGDSVTPGTQIDADVYEPVEVYWGQSGAYPSVEFVNGSGIEFNALDVDTNITVSGIELWDSSTTPVRIGWAPFTATTVVPAGEPFVIAPGQLKVKLT